MADTIAELEARWLDMDTIPVPAHWNHRPGCPPDCPEVTGDPAGAIRNRKMLRDYYDQILMVLAFHNDIANSRGTADMIKIAKKAKIPVRLFTETEEILSF